MPKRNVSYSFTPNEISQILFDHLKKEGLLPTSADKAVTLEVVTSAQTELNLTSGEKRLKAVEVSFAWEDKDV